MKLSFILFTIGLLGLVTADYFSLLRPSFQLQTAGQSHPELEAFRATLDSAYDATAEPVVTRSLSVGEITAVSVTPGFRVIHDPQMGKEVEVSAPKGVFDFLELVSGESQLTPNFTRPIRLRERVTVRVNLHAHGSRHLSVRTLSAAGDSSKLAADFVTDGPLEFDLLRLTSLPPHRIDVASRDVIVSYPQAGSDLHGTADRLEYLFEAKNVEEELLEELMSSPHLRAGEVYRTNIGSPISQVLGRAGAAAGGNEATEAGLGGEMAADSTGNR